MAAGKATILVIDGVIREVIEASGGGVFVRPGDDESLANTVLALSKDPVRLKQMSASARKYALKYLNRRDKLVETTDLLKKISSKGSCI
jgi:glycosyltransferase involved in cell wall biosynthesis